MQDLEQEAELQTEAPGLKEIKISLKEATALVTFLQHEWIGYEANGREVKEILDKLQRFVYSGVQ
jgi:hypothetical protein